MFEFCLSPALCWKKRSFTTCPSQSALWRTYAPLTASSGTCWAIVFLYGVNEGCWLDTVWLLGLGAHERLWNMSGSVGPEMQSELHKKTPYWTLLCFTGCVASKVDPGTRFTSNTQ